MYAIVNNNTPSELPAGDPVSTDTAQFSYDTLLLWSDSERAAHGIYPIVDDVIPSGKVATGFTLVVNGSVVSRQWALANAPSGAGVPISITPVQGRLALLAAGLLDEVQTAVNSSDRAAQLWYEYATIWERNNTILNELGSNLGLSSAQIDNLFVQAAAITAT